MPPVYERQQRLSLTTPVLGTFPCLLFEHSSLAQLHFKARTKKNTVIVQTVPVPHLLCLRGKLPWVTKRFFFLLQKAGGETRSKQCLKGCPENKTENEDRTSEVSTWFSSSQEEQKKRVFEPLGTPPGGPQISRLISKVKALHHSGCTSASKKPNTKH